MKNAYAVHTVSGGYYEVYAHSLAEARGEAEARIDLGDTIKQIKRLFT